MSEGPLQRLQDLLAEVVELSAHQRDSFLDRACRDEPGLRQEVEELLALDDQAADFFDDLAGDIAAAAPLEIDSAAAPRLQIGPYQALQVLGHGGMGAVYLAERVDGSFEQHVALKLLHLDMDTPQLRARFLAERQLLARLSHANIARLLDGGVTDEGRPYFVMEHVEGLPITHHCEKYNLPVEEVLALFFDVIGAVSYLHRNLVVHRDIKPSNILVDGHGSVKLLDFGIAKLLAEEPDGGGWTRTGERIMTPEYAAPEQQLGEPVTTATDVYALGVLLYELLAGVRPFSGGGPERHALTRGLPPTPSSRLRSRTRSREAGSSDAEGVQGGATSRVSWRRITGDLDSICMMALRPEPEARYQSAEQLGQDIERHVEGLPIHARKGTLGYRLIKLARRRWRAVAVAAGLLILVASGFVRERALRSDAEQARGEAVAVSDFLGDLLSSADPKNAKGREITVAEVLDQAAARITSSTELEEQPAVEATIRLTIGATYTSLGTYEAAREHLERAVALRGGLEADDPEALIAAAELGVLYHRLGLFDEAERVLRGVLDARVEALGEEHPEVLITQTQLADLYWDQGRLDEVEAIDRRSLEIRRRVLGEDHPATLKSLNGLAATLFTRGRYAEAGGFFEQALATAERQLGEDHPHTLTLRNNLAATHRAAGHHDRAEPLLRDVVAARIRVLGEAHQETAMSINNLGLALSDQGRYSEAEEQFEKAIIIREGLPGDQRAALDSRYYLAQVYHQQGRLEETRSQLLSILEQQQERFGPEDTDTLRTRAGLARLDLDEGNLEAAEATTREVREQLLLPLGEAHPDVLGCLATLARIRIEWGHFAEALEISESAVASGSQLQGADHPAVLLVAFEQARSLAGLKRTAEALEIASRILALRRTTLGKSHPETVAARNLVDDLTSEPD